MLSQVEECAQKHVQSKGLTAVCACAEEDAGELDRLRRLLCIPREEVDKVNKEICGRIYQDVSDKAPLTAPAMYHMNVAVCSGKAIAGRADCTGSMQRMLRDLCKSVSGSI